MNTELASYSGIIEGKDGNDGERDMWVKPVKNAFLFAPLRLAER